MLTSSSTSWSLASVIMSIVISSPSQIDIEPAKSSSPFHRRKSGGVDTEIVDREDPFRCVDDLPLTCDAGTDFLDGDSA
jgi:hypothetical protein